MHVMPDPECKLDHTSSLVEEERRYLHYLLSHIREEALSPQLVRILTLATFRSIFEVIGTEEELWVLASFATCKSGLGPLSRPLTQKVNLCPQKALPPPGCYRVDMNWRCIELQGYI
jgi:hypothetical protein